MYYAAMTVVPLALVLGVLVASLMTFGNLGERMELLAMKAAGIPLLTIMKPLFIFVLILAGALFVFQNDYMITSQVKFWQYYFSIKNKSPELAIPEGTFYKDLENYSIYVERKDSRAKMMYGMMIYDLTDGFDNASVILADSGKLYSTADGKELILELYSGESFQNIKDDRYYANSADRPFLREQFSFKELHILFDSDLSMMDESILSSQFVGKNLFELKAYTDSLQLSVDSLAQINRVQAYRNNNYLQTFVRADREATVQMSAAKVIEQDRIMQERAAESTVNPSIPDVEQGVERVSVYSNVPNHYALLPKSERIPYDMDLKLKNAGASARSKLVEATLGMITNKQNAAYFSAEEQRETVELKRKNEFEYWRKFTYPAACIAFFLIGAPLGALIRKGGMGVPFIVAVFFFIIFYILETFGIKMVREGTLVNWFGMWLPNLVLIPIGLWLCYIATKDVSGFNVDNIQLFFRRFFGTSTRRRLEFREVTMVDANYDKARVDIAELERRAEELIDARSMSYTSFFLNDQEFGKREKVYEQIEKVVSNLGNTRSYEMIERLQQYPFLRDLARTLRSKHKWINIIMMVIFPIGLPVYIMYLVRNKRYIRELKEIRTVNQSVLAEIDHIEMILTNN